MLKEWCFAIMFARNNIDHGLLIHCAWFHRLDNNVMHAKPDLQVCLKWWIVHSGRVITDVIWPKRSLPWKPYLRFYYQPVLVWHLALISFQHQTSGFQSVSRWPWNYWWLEPAKIGWAVHPGMDPHKPRGTLKEHLRNYTSFWKNNKSVHP